MAVQGIAAALLTNQNLVPASLKEEHAENLSTDMNLLKSSFVELLLPVLDFCEKSQSRATFVINKSRRAREI